MTKTPNIVRKNTLINEEKEDRMYLRRKKDRPVYKIDKQFRK